VRAKPQRLHRPIKGGSRASSCVPCSLRCHPSPASLCAAVQTTEAERRRRPLADSSCQDVDEQSRAIQDLQDAEQKPFHRFAWPETHRSIAARAYPIRPPAPTFPKFGRLRQSPPAVSSSLSPSSSPLPLVPPNRRPTCPGTGTSRPTGRSPSFVHLQKSSCLPPFPPLVSTSSRPLRRSLSVPHLS
jgi:hypothetical protein